MALLKPAVMTLGDLLTQCIVTDRALSKLILNIGVRAGGRRWGLLKILGKSDFFGSKVNLGKASL